MTIDDDNTEFIIRNGKLEDAEALLEIENDVIAEGDYFIGVPEEIEKTALQEKKQQIKDIVVNNNDKLIVAEINGVVIGSIVFRSQSMKRLAHTGYISMSIRKEYRGMGIGKELIKALLGWAEKNPLIEKVSLGVFSTNQRAISLYKKMGFVEEGRKVKEFKLDNGDYMDDVLMYKLV